MKEIRDEREWRISMSGFSIKTGWSDSKTIKDDKDHILAALQYLQTWDDE